MQVWSGPGPDNKLLVESYKAKRGSSTDGLAVGHLARKARDAGSSPAQHYTFHLYKFTPEKIIIYLIPSYVFLNFRSNVGKIYNIPLSTKKFNVTFAHEPKGHN